MTDLRLTTSKLVAGATRGLLALAAASAIVQGAAAEAERDCDAVFVACLEQATTVHTYCPESCTARHCSLMCMPPVGAPERCTGCQETCGKMCSNQGDRLAAACVSEREACRPEASPATDGD